MLGSPCSPGAPSIARNAPTPARASRMSRPDARVRPEKTTSPRRLVGDAGASLVVLSCIGVSAGADLADQVPGLLAQVGAQRSGPGSLRGGLLTFAAHHVGEERLRD